MPWLRSSVTASPDALQGSRSMTMARLRGRCCSPEPGPDDSGDDSSWRCAALVHAAVSEHVAALLRLAKYWPTGPPRSRGGLRFNSSRARSVPGVVPRFDTAVCACACFGLVANVRKLALGAPSCVCN